MVSDQNEKNSLKENARNGRNGDISLFMGGGESDSRALCLAIQKAQKSQDTQKRKYMSDEFYIILHFLAVIVIGFGVGVVLNYYFKYTQREYPYDQDITLSSKERHLVTFPLDTSKSIYITTKDGDVITDWTWKRETGLYVKRAEDRLKADQYVVIHGKGVRWIDENNNNIEFELPSDFRRIYQLLNLAYADERKNN